jgi:dihydroorotate dehydrogenase (fumarate)
MEAELRQWLDHHGYKSVAEIRGAASRRAAADPAAYERANYIRTLITISPSHRSG